jgi:phage/plasmid primase-like uncharacterized protein
MTLEFAAWVERARATDIGEIITQRGIRLRGRGSVFAGPCPRCGGRDRFAIHTGKDAFHCRGCGGRGRGTISLVMFLDQCDFIEAVATITGETLHVHHRRDPDRERRARHDRERIAADRARRERHQQDDEASRLRRADVIWREAVAITGTPGADYLTQRGIDLDDVPDQGGLRFHSHCPWGNGRQPCILARFTHAVTGAALGVHRRPISIPGAKPMSLGPIGGGVIRLWPDDYVEQGLVVGEGVETVLAAATRIEHRHTLLQPAWACGSAGTIASFPVLPGIEALTILADHDPPDRRGRRPGQDAARACAQRWAAAGCEGTILTPRDLGLDFNDLVR